MLSNHLKAMVQQYHEEGADWITRQKVKNTLEARKDTVLQSIEMINFNMVEANNALDQVELALKLLAHKDSNDKRRRNG